MTELPYYATFQRGDRIGQMFEVHDILGKGGYGVVYLVYCFETNAVYALKTFREDYTHKLKVREKFRREANLWIDLGQHPFVVQAHLVVEIAGRLFIATEYIAPNEQGFNRLSDYLKEQPPALAQSLRWAIQCCYGMEYAYAKGIHSHRDIKAKNIMIARDGTAKITDFGLAGALDGSGRVFGTPAYMPPEQFVDIARCDERSDIYSFGVVLYEMATGGARPIELPPHDYSSTAGSREFWRETARRHREAPILEFDSPLYPIARRCLEKEPADRYTSFAELRAELEKLLQRQTGETILVPNLREQEAADWNNRGCSLISLGRYEEARRSFDRALELNPKCAGAWNNKGNSLNSLCRFEEALHCFNRATELDAADAAIWNNRAITLDNLGRFEEALRCFDRAIEVDAQFVPAWYNKGLSLFSMGYDEDAIGCLDRVLELDPQNATAWNNKGLILKNLERDGDAIACFNRSLKIDPASAATWNNGGLIMAKYGYEEAIVCFGNAIRIDPGNVAALKNAGLMLDNYDVYEETLASSAVMVHKYS